MAPAEIVAEFPHLSVPGIVYCHQQKYSVGGLLQALLLVHSCFDAEEVENRVEFL
jgi:hypothetical protein